MLCFSSLHYAIFLIHIHSPVIAFLLLFLFFLHHSTFYIFCHHPIILSLSLPPSDPPSLPSLRPSLMVCRGQLRHCSLCLPALFASAAEREKQGTGEEKIDHDKDEGEEVFCRRRVAIMRQGEK